MTQDTAKKSVGTEAAQLIQSGMIVGLGSGTTAEFFIEALAARKLPIKAVSSSRRSADLAKSKGIPILDLNEVTHIDITVDGADEIDPKKRMIKGGGGAHVREKILAAASREMVVIVDETKLVSQLGKAKLPVEILAYGSAMTQRKIEALQYKGAFRKNFVTDNGNLIFDIQLPSPTSQPEKIHEQLIQIPGVVDTGFFFHLAGRVLVGHANGTVKIL